MTLPLVVVPARGGSVAIRGKALRPVAGVPLLLRTLRTVEQADIAARLVVSTDDREIATYARMRGYGVLDRPATLATGDVPLLEVARHAVLQAGWWGPVAICQPTCPLVTPGTLRACWDSFRRSDADWMMTVAEDPHIHWWRGRPIGDRVNRQERRPLLVETGAMQVMTRQYVTSGDGHRETFTIPADEALDVDEPADLLVAERLLRANGRVLFVVAVGHEVGTGHFWRSFALARALCHHAVGWRWQGDPEPWMAKLLDTQVPGWRAPCESPGLVVVDCLDQISGLQLLAWRAQGARVLVLEGDGSHADAAVNALLDPDDIRYFVLRDEFRHLPPAAFHEGANRVLVTFGGTDPAGLGERCRKLLTRTRGVDVVTLGPPGERLLMAEAMRDSDLVLTSQGRTVFEAAACGVPCVSIAANEREARHVRLPGVTYLGLHSIVTDAQIVQAVTATLADVGLRRANAATAALQVDGHGLRRLLELVERLLEGSNDEADFRVGPEPRRRCGEGDPPGEGDGRSRLGHGEVATVRP